MKRLFVSVFACMMVICALTVGGAADAKPIAPLWQSPPYLADVLTQPNNPDWLTQLSTEVLPQLENILTAEQHEQFKADVSSGISFRKAFKTLMLTPTQKTQLKALLKSVPKRDAFAALTPEQKQQLFQKEKAGFIPTSDEIRSKIDAAMRAKGAALPDAVREKIEAGIQKKDAFLPGLEAVAEEIRAGMDLLKDIVKD